MASALSEALRAALPTYGVAPAPDCLARLTAYLERLTLWNRRIRLVGSTDPDVLARRHVGESLYLSRLLPLTPATTLLDVGSGAGFPGLALQIVFPEINATLVESNHKKAAFLQEMVRQCGGGRVVAARAEVVQERSQIVTLRALERMGDGPERFAHLLIPGAKLAAWISRAMAEDWRRRWPEWRWAEPQTIPASHDRVILTGTLPD